MSKLGSVSRSSTFNNSNDRFQEPPSKSLFNKFEINLFEAGVWINRYKLYLFFCNFIYLGISIVLFVIGILYLSTFKHEYELSQYSITFIAAFYLTVSLLGFIFVFFNFLVLCYNRSIVLLVTTCITILLYFVILLIGIVALSVSQEESLRLEIQGNMVELILDYDENDHGKHGVKKIDWIQRKYQCCGIDDSTDWRIYYQNKTQFTTAYPSQSKTDNKNYYDYVPDSCCIDESRGCGKVFNSFTENSYKQLTINTKGCQIPYQKVLVKDLDFLGGLGVMVSTITLVISVVSIIFYSYVRFREENK